MEVVCQQAKTKKYGGDDVRLLYNFEREYLGPGDPQHLFRVECHTACCHIQTIDYPEHNDDVDSIRNSLNYVVPVAYPRCYST